MTRFCTIVAVALLALAGQAGQSAFAEDATGPARLPGVDAQAGEAVVGIDRTRTQSGAERESDREDGWVRVGDWDVKISGEVTYDIGTKKVLPDTR